MLRFSKLVKQEENRHLDELEYLPIDSIVPNPYQPRKFFSEDSLAELAGSIKEMGLLQPITVRRIGQDRYELVAGERRLRASKLAGCTEIKAIIISGTTDGDMAILAMLENLQRDNLHFFEEAEGYQSLIREHGFTQEELARQLSKNQSTVANKLRLLKLPRRVKGRGSAAGLTERHARALLRLHNEEAQMALLDAIIGESLSVKDTEELVEKELSRLYGEEKEEPRKLIKMNCSYKIYINTIKKVVNKIAVHGVKTVFDYAERDDCTEVTIKLMK